MYLKKLKYQDRCHPTLKAKAHCIITYPSSKKAFSVSPVRQVATASMNVVMPNVAWIGTSEARKAAVDPSQHSRMRKLKKPTTNCDRKEN
jgi:hypothetical protein